MPNTCVYITDCPIIIPVVAGITLTGWCPVQRWVLRTGRCEWGYPPGPTLPRSSGALSGQRHPASQLANTNTMQYMRSSDEKCTPAKQKPDCRLSQNELLAQIRIRERLKISCCLDTEVF